MIKYSYWMFASCLAFVAITIFASVFFLTIYGNPQETYTITETDPAPGILSATTDGYGISLLIGNIYWLHYAYGQKGLIDRYYKKVWWRIYKKRGNHD